MRRDDNLEREIVSRKMPFEDKLRSLLRFKIFQKNASILEDGAKYTLIFGQVFGSTINVCPDDFDRFKPGNLIIMALCLVHTVASIMFVIMCTRDVGTLTKVMSSAECVIQVTGKFAALFFKSKALHGLILTIRDEFWPSNIVNEDTDREIRKESNRISKLFAIEFLSALFFLVLCSVLPFTKHERVLPYSTWYPFDWTASPAYEILYVFHTYFNVCLDIPAVLAYDTLFFAICFNCSAQFRLLCEAIGYVGGGNEEEITERLLKIPGVENTKTASEDWKEMKLLTICIKHHQKLIRVCNEINKTFGNGHLVQLFVSAVGICSACYSITIETNFNARAYLMLFYLCHIFQLFIYCSVSNELFYWSTRLFRAAYDSSWYVKEYSDIRRCLGIVMMQSQTAITMNAFGLFELNYVSFLSVIRFTFSLYTFLTKIASK